MSAHPFYPRDFIETPEGLIFAVVDGRPEEARVLCFLRYLRQPPGFRKLPTGEAESHLMRHGPEYLYDSKRLDARLHAVPVSRIQHHFRPRERVRQLLSAPYPDVMEDKAVRWLRLFSRHGLDLTRAGLTGSLLIGAENAESDLDFVIYGRETFFAARNLVRTLLDSGDLDALNETAWRDTYERRGCSLDFKDYVWHERRKLNKALFARTKFDISLVPEELPPEEGPVRKLGTAVLKAEVTDVRSAFDHPARYRLNHPEIKEVLSFTHTYAGQAEAGERVEISGVLEETHAGIRRVVVGSSREAPGEYIRVIKERAAWG